MNWIPTAEARKARYEEQFGDLDERSIVRKGNTAYAAGLALLMAGDVDAAEWLRRAAAAWRESWSGGESWGRPIGALKASLLAHDDAAVEELATWTLTLGTPTAESPIGRYAAALGLLALGRWPEARHVAESLRERDDFPRDVGDALAYIAADDAVGYVEAVESVVDSFETRDEYLEDVAVADTALVLQELARRRGIEHALPASPVLP
ncbi:MAG: family finger-like protein [Actinomycetia bacterium]|nr:family finger-like protein [Actinomycetes bacterium]